MGDVGRVIPPNYEAIVGVAAASFIIHYIYMPSKVMAARKKYRVKYPALYATKDDCEDDAGRKAYNCVQRGHQNSLELQPAILSMISVSGLWHPIVSASFGALYLAGRVVYFHGYSSGDPNGRLKGAPLYGPGMLGLLGTSLKIFGFWVASKLL